MTTVQISGAPGLDTLQTEDVTSPSRLGSALQRATRPVSAVREIPHFPTYVGMALTVVGGLLLLLAWGKTAGLTNVALQVPFLISAGCTGLALVAVGLSVVNMAAKAQDARRREEQLLELRDLLAELRQTVQDPS